MEKAAAKIKDWRWRMDNLYYITDKLGRTIKFKMNAAQEAVYEGMHYRNVILKSRQLGMTTFKMILMLDQAIFRPNTRCAIICHSKDDAARLFDEKVKFAYNRLPDAIKNMVQAVNDRSGELKFSNGSSLTVGTSFRGGTLRYLHVSEFGKICAKYPDKAKEIVSGAFEAVGQDCVITLESTAEGRLGYFAEYCHAAEMQQLSNKDLANLDWKFFFFPWDLDPTYTVDVGEEIPQRIEEYFFDLSIKTGKRYTEGQKRWYFIKEKTLGNEMKREYPSTPEEAFAQSIEGAYYERQFRDLYAKKQITRIPHDPSAAVHTVWDIGVNDQNAIWFVQLCGREWHIIDYYENSGEGLSHYIGVLNQKRNDFGYEWGYHVAPHDIAVREWGSDGKSRLEIARGLGILFEIAPKLPVNDGIESVRSILPMCWFDAGKCEIGISRLQGYRKDWNEKLGIWRDRPLHDENSNGSDAFRYFAVSTTLLQNKFSSAITVAPKKRISPLAWS